jgi:GNAT superfamily N-acetyltransferase
MIRKMNVCDIPAWKALAKEVEHLFGKMLGVPEFETGMINAINLGLAFCAYNDSNEIFGIIAIDRGNNSIDWLAVAKQARGKHFGHQLLETAISQLDEKKEIIVQTFSEVIDEGKPARYLYKHFGFFDHKDAGINPAGIPTTIMIRPASA